MKFKDQLKRVQAMGHLSSSELALWFERPTPTIYGWLRGGGVRPAWLDEIERRLSKLEALTKQGEIIPYRTPWKTRATILKRLRDAQLPEPNSRSRRT